MNRPIIKRPAAGCNLFAPAGGPFDFELEYPHHNRLVKLNGMKDKRPLPIRLKQESGEISLELPMPDPPNEYEEEFPSIRALVEYMVAENIVLTRGQFRARSYIVGGIDQTLGRNDPLWNLGETILGASDDDIQRLRKSRAEWKPDTDQEPQEV